MIYAFMTVMGLACMLPMLLVAMVSVTDEKVLAQNGYSLLPAGFSLYAYSLIFTDSSPVAGSYLVSITVTVTGTLAAVLITAMAAFALANRQVRHRNALALFFFITMVFNAGLVPWYMVCRALHLTDNLLALIVPSLLFSPFNLFLVRNFMNGIPDSLMESARIDGASDPVICFRVYFPLCTPVLATITLFYGVAYWNDWFNAIMLVNNNKLYPLQYLLYKIQSEIRMLAQLATGTTTPRALPTDSFKMATAIVTIGPILLLYPYLQRYFIKGLTIGSVKG